jgi:hypothetical protein
MTYDELVKAVADEIEAIEKRYGVKLVPQIAPLAQVAGGFHLTITVQINPNAKPQSEASA